MHSRIFLEIVFLVIVIVLLVIIFLMRRENKRILQSISKMLDEAVDGTFQEEKYDESMLSAVELRMAQYLMASEVSKNNLAAEKDKIKQLIADISHQTKTPIANILLFAQLLREQEIPEGSREYVESINGQAEKLNFLIQALVKTSRLENGIMEIHPCMTELGSMLQEVVDQIMPLAKKKDIEVLLEETKAQVYMDKKWTEEAVYNIVHNAVKYTKEHGKIEIKVKEYELFTSISIKDNGIGIREEEHARIFGRFYRSTDVCMEEGVGIGLFLSRQIVSKEGGYIKVASSLGEGSTFSVYLPREKK